MDTDTLYAAGSDDFKAYVWKIPPLTELMEARQKIAADEWSLTDSKRIGDKYVHLVSSHHSSSSFSLHGK